MSFSFCNNSLRNASFVYHLMKLYISGWLLEFHLLFNNWNGTSEVAIISDCIDGFIWLVLPYIIPMIITTQVSVLM